jgi:hypothetical protein
MTVGGVDGPFDEVVASANGAMVVVTADDGGDHVAVSGPPIAAHAQGDFTPLRFADVRDVVPGHAADARPGSVPDHEHRRS